MFLKKKILIPEFYKDKSLFITGATGFIGKVLVEKLLRSCPDLKNIYILIRQRKNKTVEERLNEMFSGPLFDTLRRNNESAFKKVIPISGDITELKLGISEEDREILINNVTIVYHVAASVRFDDFLTKAIITNVRSTREVTRLLEDLKTVDVFVHLSTAYSNCDHKVIEEKLYPAKFSWRDAIDIAENSTENFTEILCLKFLDQSPNTYTFTKALAEQLVNDVCKERFPTVVLRPSIVVCTYSDPVTGFIDTFNGPVGLFVAGGKGINRFLLSNPEVNQDHVFVDNVVKAIIISSWEKAVEPDLSNINYYNVAADAVFSPKFTESNFEKMMENPLQATLWVPSFQAISCWYQYYVYFIFYQLIPAAILDVFLKIKGAKLSIWFLTRKIFIVNKALETFTRNEWTIKCDNYVNLETKLMEKDMESFSFILNRFAPNSYLELRKITEIIALTRIYLLKEKPYASEEHKIKMKRLSLINDVLKFVFKILAVYVICWKYNALSIIFNWIREYFVTVGEF